MKENIILNRYREFGDILSDTFVVIKQNFKPLLKSYFVICGLFLVANILVSAFFNSNRGDLSIHTFAELLALVFSLITHTALLLTVLSYLVLYKEKSNQPPDVLEVWGYFRYYFFRVFFTHVLLVIAAIIGCFLCLIPGIYLVVVFSLVIPVMVIENGSIEYSFKRAFKIIKDNWWFTFGLLLMITIVTVMVMLIFMLPTIIIYGSAQWLTGASLNNTASIIQAIVINLCQVLWTVPIVSIALLYYSLTEEKEGNSLINRIKMFGKSTSDSTDQASSEQY